MYKIDATALTLANKLLYKKKNKEIVERKDENRRNEKSNKNEKENEQENGRRQQKLNFFLKPMGLFSNGAGLGVCRTYCGTNGKL